MQCARKRLRCSWMLARSYLPRFRDMYRMLQNPTMLRQKKLTYLRVQRFQKIEVKNLNFVYNHFFFSSTYLFRQWYNSFLRKSVSYSYTCMHDTIITDLTNKQNTNRTLHANFVSTKNRSSSKFSYLHPFNRLSWKPPLLRCFAWDNLFYIWVINLRRIRAENRLLQPAFLADYP